MKLAIGMLIAHGFPLPVEFSLSYERMKEHMRIGQCNSYLPAHLQITQIQVIQSTAFPIDVARNEICRRALADGFDYLFFADCDQVFQPDTIGKLLAADKPVISGRYHMRREPYHAVAYVKHKTQDGPHCYAPVHFGSGVFEIERGGAGCLLIRRDVLQAIADRQAHDWTDALAWMAEAPPHVRKALDVPPVPTAQWFRYQRGPEPPHDMTVSEDFWFWQQAREAGFSCWLDWDVEAGHLQTFPINRSWNESYLDAQVRALPVMAPEARQRALDSFVVCGLPDGIRLASGDHVPAYVMTAGER